jgi:DNA-binding NarL/FixJ family response regulator
MSKPPESPDTRRLRVWTIDPGDGVVAVVSAPARPPDAPELTRAERDIVESIARGERNRAIARRRGTSERTVANQIAALFAKLGVVSRAELLVYLRDRR